MSEQSQTTSPRWGRNTKLVISLILIAILGGLLLRFHSLLGPVLFSFILAYLLHPVVSFLDRRLLRSWRFAVNLIYLVFVLLLLSLLTWGGFNLVGQVSSLINLVQTSITQLPDFINSISGKIITFGPFHLNLANLDLPAIGKEVLSIVEPLLGKMGDLVSNAAGSAISTFGWLAFILLASYFFLLESGGLREGIIRVDIPGYDDDIRRLGKKLGAIWNAFLRGQFIIFSLTVLVYSIVWPILGVHYALGLALLAGLASFLPYIGPAINWIALGLVTFFQDPKPFNLSALAYTGLAIVIGLVIDQIFNNLIAPRILSRALKVHPAAVLISAIIAANLIGIIGILVAAPLLATIMLIGRYLTRKLLDHEPWPASDEVETPKYVPILTRLNQFWSSLTHRRVKPKP